MHSLYLPLHWADVIVAASMFLGYLLFDILAKQQKHRGARIAVAALALTTASIATWFLMIWLQVGFQP